MSVKPFKSRLEIEKQILQKMGKEIVFGFAKELSPLGHNLQRYFVAASNTLFAWMLASYAMGSLIWAFQGIWAQNPQDASIGIVTTWVFLHLAGIFLKNVDRKLRDVR